MRHNPTPLNTTLPIDNMADEEKEKAEKVAAAKKRVRIIFHPLLNRQAVRIIAPHNQHQCYDTSSSTYDIASCFPFRVLKLTGQISTSN